MEHKPITRKFQLKNRNYPKCKSCIFHNCDAGEINHNCKINIGRAECLFNCGCTKFEKFGD